MWTTAKRLAWRSILAAWLAIVGCALVAGGVAQAETGTVMADGLRLRSDMWGQVLGSLPAGAWVRINARATDPDGDAWYYVTTARGSLGWVYAGYVTSARDARARVGIQVGHWRYQDADYPLNLDAGAVASGLTESEVNLAIALVLSRRLSARGYTVDLLPTRVPIGYRADAVVAIHADSGPSHVRGFFVDRPPRSPVAAAEAALARYLIASHSRWTGIPYVPRSTVDSRLYYAFRDVHPMTPIVLIETGCLTNAADRAIIAGRPDLVADGLTEGIDAFLSR